MVGLFGNVFWILVITSFGLIVVAGCDKRKSDSSTKKEAYRIASLQLSKYFLQIGDSFYTSRPDYKGEKIFFEGKHLTLARSLKHDEFIPSPADGLNSIDWRENFGLNFRVSRTSRRNSAVLNSDSGLTWLEKARRQVEARRAGVYPDYEWNDWENSHSRNQFEFTLVLKKGEWFLMDNYGSSVLKQHSRPNETELSPPFFRR